MQSRPRAISALLMIVFPFVVFADIACPDVSSISRVPGEYAWESTDGRWQGYFASPRIGRGESANIKFFQQTRWIQLNTLPNSPGVVECDYLGNYDQEVIRFVSIDSTASAKPTGLHWNCEFNPEVPGTQCLCTGDPGECRLPL